MNAAPLSPNPFGGLSWTGKLALLLLGGGFLALTLKLWPQWRDHPDLSHGFFMPLLFALLLAEGRTSRHRYLAAGPASQASTAALIIGGLLLLLAAGLYAASLDWSHALVNLMLTLALMLFMGAGVLVFSQNSLRLIPCNWPVITAIGLWLLTTPIPPGTYSRLTLHLQLWVSESVLRTLHILGIAAIRQGNIIDLANATVGVEEACSGVRSLISCLFAGLFFSATLVSRPWARALIILLAAPLALAMNFSRSLALTLLANAHVDISGAWHDATGFAVLGVTAALLGGFAIVLEPRKKAAARSIPPVALNAASTSHQGILAGGLALATALTLFYTLHTPAGPSPPRAPAPDLFALLPTPTAGWHAKSSNLFTFRDALQTDHLAQRSYFKNTPRGPVEIIIYVAYWRPGQTPVSQVALHTPDACWPGSGWVLLPRPTTRTFLELAHRRLALAEHRVFVGNDEPRNVWYWHLHNRQPISYRDPYSAIELLRLGWRFGFRAPGEQLFVRVSSNRPWNEIAPELILTTFFENTQAMGL